MGDQAALSGGLRLIDVRQILDVFLDQTQSHLQELSHNLVAQGDNDRKRALLLFLHNTKQRLLRLLIIVKWANKARVVAEVGRILDVAARQANACRDAADQLAYLHGELEDSRVPAYDVPTALEVLQTGTLSAPKHSQCDYASLPSCIEELRPPPAPSPAVRRARLRLMDQILRSTLLQEKLPAGVAVTSVGGGVAELRSGKLWEARLTLVPVPPPPPKLPATQQDSSGGDAEGVEGDASRQKPQEAGVNEHNSNAGGPSQPGSTEAQPMDMDVQHGSDAQPAATSADASCERRDEPALAGGVLDERWRWRVLSAKALPHFTGTALMAPQQASQLQGAIEMRMWAASEIAEEDDRRGVAQLENTQEEPIPGATKQGPSAGSGPGAETEMISKIDAAGASNTAQEELKPRQSPLAILHGVLQDVGSRLVLNEAVLWARAATKGTDGRWAKLLRIEPAKRLSLGIRILYWVNVPTVTSADLRRLQQPESVLPPQRSTQQPQQHTPPAVEIGVAKGGEPSIVACPELLHAIDSVHAPAPGAAVALSMDLVSLDAEAVLLRAAQANAAIQLAAIEALLRRSGNLQANNGAITLLPPADDGGASGARPSPVLELCCDRAPLLCVSVQLRTGRLLLCAGEGGSASFNSLGQELGPLLRQEEERLAALQAEALKQVPADGLGTVGAAAADRLARSLESLWLNLSVRSRCAQLLSAAQNLGLYRAQIPAALLKAYAAANPLARLPAKNAFVLAFPPAPTMPAPAESPAGGVSGRERLDGLLGRGGAGVQLFLQAEMCRGLQWRYSLVIAGCDARNMPIKVLQVLPVPVEVDARQPSTPSAALADTSRAQASGKPEEGVTAPSGAQPSGRQPEQAMARGVDGTAGVGKAEAEGTPGEDASHQARWGLRHAAELGEVVRWCAPRITWELLRLQLKALGIGFTEEVDLAQLPAAASAYMANGQAAPAALKDKTAAAIAASGALQRCLRLHGLHSLQLLDHANGVSGSSGVLMRVAPDSQRGQSAWQVTVQSAYFGGLPASCAACFGHADAGCGGAQHISQNPDGLTLDYSFATGGTVERATADLRRLIRMHLTLARMAALMRAASAAASETTQNLLQASDGPSKPPADALAAKTQRRQSKALANGNTEEHSAAAPTRNGSGQKDTGPDAGQDSGSAPATSALTWQAQEGSGVVSISAVGPDRAVLLVTPPSEAGGEPAGVAAEAADDRADTSDGAVANDTDAKQHTVVSQLQISMEWAAGKPSLAPKSRAGAGSGGGRKAAQGFVPGGIRCRMFATPVLPAAVMEAFADMADAGEEELLLDALSVCGCALATLAAELAPEALLHAGVLPEETSLYAIVPPYKLRLTIARGLDSQLAVGMHLLAGGLIWLAPSAGREHVRTDLMDRLSRLPEAFLPDATSGAAADHEAEETKGRGPQTAPSVLDSAMEIDGVSSPPLEPPSSSAAAAARQGLWVRTTALPAALRTVLKVAAEMD